MTGTYVPLVGSIAARAIAHLQALPEGAEIASGPLADALGCHSSMVNVCLDTASKRGVLVRDKREGRIYWKLGQVPVAPPPAPAEAADPDDAGDEDAAPIVRTIPSAAAEPIVGLRQQSWCPVAQDAGATGSQGELEAPPPSPPAPMPAGLDWKAPRGRVPVFARDAAEENTTPVAAPEPARADTAEANDETVRALSAELAPVAATPTDDPDFREVDPAPRPAADSPQGAFIDAALLEPYTLAAPSPAEGFRCALWSSGTLEMRTSDGEHVLLSEDDARELIRYIADVLAPSVRADA